MGQQQLLLIILGGSIVGIAIAVGISQFGAHSAQSNKDGVTSGLVNLAANAYQYRIRPTSMGGGNGVYDGYALAAPSKMLSDNNGTYVVTSASGGTAVFTATSTMNSSWTAQCTEDSTGNTSITFTG